MIEGGVVLVVSVSTMRGGGWEIDVVRGREIKVR